MEGELRGCERATLNKLQRRFPTGSHNGSRWFSFGGRGSSVCLIIALSIRRADGESTHCDVVSGQPTFTTQRAL